MRCVRGEREGRRATAVALSMSQNAARLNNSLKEQARGTRHEGIAAQHVARTWHVKYGVWNTECRTCPLLPKPHKAGTGCRRAFVWLTFV